MLNRKHPMRVRENSIMQQIPLHLMLLPGIAVVLVYNYLPMAGLIIAFQNFKPTRGFLGSEWISLKNFQKFFSYADTPRIIGNTVYHRQFMDDDICFLLS